MICPATGLCDTARSQSLPAPTTSELGLVVLTVTYESPEGALWVAAAPVPAALVYPATVIEPAQEPKPRLAVTAHPLSAVRAGAVQISATPKLRLAKATRCHGSPQPVTREKLDPAPVASLDT